MENVVALPTRCDDPEVAASTRCGLPRTLLDGYVEMLADAARTGRRPDRVALDRRRELGVLAGNQGVTIRALTELYLAATELAWPTLPGVRDAATASQVRAAGQAVTAAAARALAAVVEGFEDAQRLAVRREGAARREFVDDLLQGGSDLGRLAERAQRYGVLLAGTHVVAVARAERPFTDDDRVTQQVESALVNRFGGPNVLVATRDGLLVCILPSTLRGAPGEFAHQLLTVLGTESGWKVGVGRPRSGPGGVVQSYEEARNTLQLADRLGFRTPVLHAADLLVFPVLLRDRAAIADLVISVLGPLATVRGGVQPMLDTLNSFFACQGNHAATARALGISVRAVGYRLERIRRITGYAPTEATQRFTLEAAVLGARLLDWPDHPLDTTH